MTIENCFQVSDLPCFCQVNSRFNFLLNFVRWLHFYYTPNPTVPHGSPAKFSDRPLLPAAKVKPPAPTGAQTQCSPLPCCEKMLQTERGWCVERECPSSTLQKGRDRMGLDVLNKEARAKQREELSVISSRRRDQHLPWTVPQGYWRARTILFPIFTSSVLPTTAKGKWPCRAHKNPQTNNLAEILQSILSSDSNRLDYATFKSI